MEEQVIHVVLAIHDPDGEYSRHVGVAIVSIFENTNSKVIIHLFHDTTLTDENKQHFKKIANDYLQCIQFHLITLSTEVQTLHAMKYMSIGTLYRLNIMNELPDVSKSIYIDSDVVFAIDIKELFSINIENYAVAAVLDAGAKKNPKLYGRYIPVDITKYFNAGMILFNLKKIRENYHMFEDSIKLLVKYPKDPFTDQSALNHIFQEDCLFIDEKYNCFPDDSKNIQNKCWHFAGGLKPWQARKYKVDALYWKYLQKTPWGTDVQRLFQYYSLTVVPLDVALLTHPIGGRRTFFLNVFKRVFREIKETKDRFFK